MSTPTSQALIVRQVLFKRNVPVRQTYIENDYLRVSAIWAMHNWKEFLKNVVDFSSEI